MIVSVRMIHTLVRGINIICKSLWVSEVMYPRPRTSGKKEKIMKTEIKKTDKYGNIFYYNEKDQLHRDNGLPAVEYADGYKEWRVNGKLHREGGLPAVEYADGYKAWYVNGVEMTEAEAKKMFAKPKPSKTIDIDALNAAILPLGYKIVKV